MPFEMKGVNLTLLEGSTAEEWGECFLQIRVHFKNAVIGPQAVALETLFFVRAARQDQLDL